MSITLDYVFAAFSFCHGIIYVTGLKSLRCARLEVLIVHIKAPAGGDCGAGSDVARSFEKDKQLFLSISQAGK